MGYNWLFSIAMKLENKLWTSFLLLNESLAILLFFIKNVIKYIKNSFFPIHTKYALTFWFGKTEYPFKSLMNSFSWKKYLFKIVKENWLYLTKIVHVFLHMLKIKYVTNFLHYILMSKSNFNLRNHSRICHRIILYTTCFI